MPLAVFPSDNIQMVNSFLSPQTNLIHKIKYFYIMKSPKYIEAAALFSSSLVPKFATVENNFRVKNTNLNKQSDESKGLHIHSCTIPDLIHSFTFLSLVLYISIPVCSVKFFSTSTTPVQFCETKQASFALSKVKY